MLDEKRNKHVSRRSRKENQRFVLHGWYEALLGPVLTSHDSSSRAFPLTAAISSLIYNALTAALCTYLPRDSVVIGYGASCYAIAGCFFSIAGIYGILTRSSNLTTAFSHFLLLDAFVSSITRLLILELFFNTTHSQDTCSDVVEAFWTNQQEPSHAIVTSSHWQESLTEAGIWCRFALGTVHLVCVGVLFCTSAAQGSVAVAIRSVGKHFGQNQVKETRHGRVEIVVVDVDATEKR